MAGGVQCHHALPSRVQGKCKSPFVLHPDSGSTKYLGGTLLSHQVLWRDRTAGLSRGLAGNLSMIQNSCWVQLSGFQVLHMSIWACQALSDLESTGLTKMCLLNSSGVWATRLYIPTLIISCKCQQGSHGPGSLAPRQQEYNKSSKLPICGHEARV